MEALKVAVGTDRWLPYRGRRDVAVLIDEIHPGSISLHIVNLNPGESRDVVLQAGAFGEHQFTVVKQVDHYPHQFDTVNGKAKDGGAGQAPIFKEMEPWDETVDGAALLNAELMKSEGLL